MTPFGTTRAGEAVHAIDLRGGALAARILTRGAILRELRLDGVDRNLTVGSDDLALYDGTMRYHGALIAPVANRLRGARAPIAGEEHCFEANQAPHTLHSAGAGTHLKLWEVEEEAADAVALALSLIHI